MASSATLARCSSSFTAAMRLSESISKRQMVMPGISLRRLSASVSFWGDKPQKNDSCHEKDDLEAQICQQIKANRLDPREAFDKLTVDWVT